MRLHDRLLARLFPRPLPRLIARLGWPSLDDKLAQGVPPESDPILAARARLLVRPAYRHTLAHAWRGLIAEAHVEAGDEGRRRPRTLHVSLPHDRILAAEGEIEQLSDALQASVPVPVRGVAMADRLLRDGTGPVYTHRSPEDLRIALTEATRYLDPLEALSEALAGALA